MLVPVYPFNCQDSGSARAFHECARIAADLAHKALAPFSSQFGTGRTRGTDGSNPASSSEESANFHSLEPEALTDPARQALRSTRLVDLFIALCTASDECNPEPPRDITNVKRDHRDLGLADLILAGIKRAGASFTLRALS